MPEYIKAITCFPGEPSFIFRWEKKVKPSSTHPCLRQSVLGGVCGNAAARLLRRGKQKVPREGAVILRAVGPPRLPGRG